MMNDYLTMINNRAVIECDTDATDVVIPDGVISIRQYAFAYCKSLESITIPNSVEFIADSAFSGCSSLKSITIPNSVTTIGRYTFRDCESLKSITIPNSVTSINIEAFYGRANVVIHCYKNSYAEEYAKEHYIPYKIID